MEGFKTSGRVGVQFIDSSIKVIENVLPFLAKRTLKDVRLVCKDWHRASVDAVGKKLQLNLSRLEAAEGKNSILFYQNCDPNLFQSLRLWYYEYDPHNPEQDYWNPIDCDVALSNCCYYYRVHSLSIKGKNQLQSLVKSANLRMLPNLESLDLSITQVEDFYQNYSFHNGVLSRIRILQICKTYLSSGSPTHILLQSLLNSAPNLRELCSTSTFDLSMQTSLVNLTLDVTRSTNDVQVAKLVEEMLQGVKNSLRNLELLVNNTQIIVIPVFPHLTQLHLQAYSWDPREDNSEFLTFPNLFEATPNLKKLEIFTSQNFPDPSSRTYLGKAPEALEYISFSPRRENFATKEWTRDCQSFLNQAKNLKVVKVQWEIIFNRLYWGGGEDRLEGMLNLNVPVLIIELSGRLNPSLLAKYLIQYEPDIKVPNLPRSLLEIRWNWSGSGITCVREENEKSLRKFVEAIEVIRKRWSVIRLMHFNISEKSRRVLMKTIKKHSLPVEVYGKNKVW